MVEMMGMTVMCREKAGLIVGIYAYVWDRLTS